MHRIFITLFIFRVLPVDATVQLNQSNIPPETQGFIDEILTVGNDQTCDFNTIQTAINAVPDNSQSTYEIRVTNQQEWNTSLVVENKDNFRMFGRFANCTDAMNNLAAGNRSVINNVSPSFAGVFISGSTTLLSSFEIKGGNNSGVIVADNSNANLSNFMIHDNSNNAADGGGVLVVDSTLWIANSQIENNAANNGAGVFCDGSVLTTYQTAIDSNTTNQVDGSGGGMFLTGCIASINNGLITQDFDAGVTNNIAARYGAGVYAEAGSKVRFNALPDTFGISQFIIADNTISNTVTNLASAGAGIYATGLSTEVLAYATSISSNEIETNLQIVGGAAVAIADQASFTMLARTNKIVCDDPQSDDRSCNQIKHNVTKSGDAAVIKITGGAQAKIYNASIFGNETLSTTNQLASVIDGDLTMQGVLVYDNGPVANPPMVQFPTRLFRISTAGTFHGDFMTIIDNRLWNGSVIQSFNSSKVNLTRSIAQTVNAETLYNDSGNPSTTLFKCLLTDENSSFSGTQITVDDPVFQPTLPYRLTASSIGVNLCTQSFGDLVPEPDIDGEERGPCPGTCGPQRFDAGADEFTTPDLIFKNGFELLL